MRSDAYGPQVSLREAEIAASVKVLRPGWAETLGLLLATREAHREQMKAGLKAYWNRKRAQGRAST